MSNVLSNVFLRKITTKLNSLIRSEDIIDFGKFLLAINNRDYGGLMYKNKNMWADLICPIHKEIIDRFRPTIFLDIGANYGFTSLLHFVENPNCNIIAVEPSPLLIYYLQKNFRINKLYKYKLVNSICSERESLSCDFSLNPSSSQDNRVKGLNSRWRTVKSSSTTIDYLLNFSSDRDFIYIKIDTQGFEEYVFKGGQKFLSTHSNWLIKTEFAPKWLCSQGSDPVHFLEDLTSKYLVCEMPKRACFKGNSLKFLASQKINHDEIFNFVKYITLLAGSDGWCDLLVMPKEIQLDDE